uniref:Uncharacterized protein n=1 Tax=Panagrolaimus sp. PS1159 TaxID=55785 RepID=A0AC35GG93_9BILA
MYYPNTFPTYNGICTQSDTNTICNCYLDKIFDFFDVPNNPYRFLEAYLEAVQDPNQVPGICIAKKHLDKCIGKSVIQNCFNIKDFRKIDFIESNQEARIMITNYLQLDYACGAVYNLLTEKLDCVLNAVDTCFGDYNTCTNAYGLINCGVKKVKSNCGNPAGCFAQKYLSLQKCYYLSDCDFCDSINYIYNPINNICSEDSNYGSHHGGGSNANFNFNNILLVILIAFYLFL